MAREAAVISVSMVLGGCGAKTAPGLADLCPDADADGFAAAWCGGTDCDDCDPSVHPGTVEDLTRPSWRVDEVAVVPPDASLATAIRPMGSPVVVIVSPTVERSLRVVERSSACRWADDENAPDGSVVAADVAVTDDDVLHLVAEMTLEPGSALRLFTRKEFAWDVVTTSPAPLAEPALVVGGNAATVGGRADGAVIVAQVSAAGWSFERLAAQSGWPAVAAASGDLLVLYTVFGGDGPSIWLARGRPGAWESEEVMRAWESEEILSGLMASSAIAVSRDGFVHVFSANSQTVLHAWRDESGWVTEMIDPRGIAHSIELTAASDPTGVAHVAYLDPVLRELRHVWQEDGAWRAEIVAEPVQGSASDLVVDARGTLHLFYVDSDAGALWHAELQSPDTNCGG